MGTRNCCSGCAGVDDVYSCSSPIRRSTVVPLASTNPVNVKPAIAKKEEKATAIVKKAEAVKVNVR